MALTDVIKRALAGELRLARGRVTAIEPTGRVRVCFEPAGGREVVCDVLRTGAESAPPALPGTEVLVAWTDEPGKPGVILGAIGPAEARAESSAPAPGTDTLPAAASPAGEPLRIAHHEIVIEAGEGLTLRCGEASIRITRDGKIILRGKNILSRAEGTQRIKGGSVAIN